MYEILVGMNREAVRKFASDLLAQADNEHVDLTLYAHLNSGENEEVTMQFSNDDMERDDVKPTDVYVDIERS